MKKILETIILNDKKYDVIIEKKKIKNCYLRFIGGAFHVSCPRLFPKLLVMEEIKKHAPKLIKEPRVDLQNHKIKILGEFIYSPTDIYNIFGYSFLITNEEDFYKKTKPLLLKYISLRVQYYKEQMKIPLNYKVRVQKMNTRLGSNSKATNTLNFSLKLIHFSKNAIDSVVVHELAHYFYFDHSGNFYNVVYKYCPDYDKLNKEFKD